MLLHVRQLAYRYPDGTPALDGVSFEIAAGERVGLIGPNGAGKSTLLWHLNGLLPERPQGRGEGRGAVIEVDGLAVADPNLPAVRKIVGLVFQDPDDQLFSATVWEDIAFGPRNLGLSADDVRERVEDALAAVGLPAEDQRVPHHLSVGERKRACLAGVLACRPKLLALDEPTANLDPRGRRQLADILRALDCAQLIASHDLEFIGHLTTRVILLDGGRVHADRPTRDVLGDRPLLAAHGLDSSWGRGLQ